MFELLSGMFLASGAFLMYLQMYSIAYKLKNSVTSELFVDIFIEFFCLLFRFFISGLVLLINLFLVFSLLWGSNFNDLT